MYERFEICLSNSWYKINNYPSSPSVCWSVVYAGGLVVAHHIPAGQSGPLGSGAHHQQPTLLTNSVTQSVSAPASPGVLTNWTNLSLSLSLFCKFRINQKSCTCPAPGTTSHLTCNRSRDVCWIPRKCDVEELNRKLRVRPFGRPLLAARNKLRH